MRLFSIIFFYKKADDQEPIKLSEAMDLSTLAFFKRGTAKEVMVFFCREVVKRTANNSRVSISRDEHVAHVYVDNDGLSCVVLTDKEYPTRVAFDIIRQSFAAFGEAFSSSSSSFSSTTSSSLLKKEWKTISADSNISIDALNKLLQNYQQPQQVDKILKIQQDVDETKSIMIKNLEEMLNRGEKIEDIVNKSKELSKESKTFVRESKKLNSCCKW